MALCVLHHQRFDLGVFALDPAGIVLVSEQFHGTTAFEEDLRLYHGSGLRSLLQTEWRLFRVFDFGRTPRVYILLGSLRVSCRLEPMLFRAMI